MAGQQGVAAPAQGKGGPFPGPGPYAASGEVPVQTVEGTGGSTQNFGKVYVKGFGWFFLQGYGCFRLHTT